MARPKSVGDRAEFAKVLRLVQKIGPENVTLAEAGKRTGEEAGGGLMLFSHCSLLVSHS